MLKITLLNVYGSNLGDRAIVESTLSILSDTRVPNIDLSIIAAENLDKILYNSQNFKSSYSISPYGISVLWSKSSSLKKALSFCWLVSSSFIFALFGVFSQKLIAPSLMYKYIVELRRSDLILCCGGGYLRSKNPYKDFYGICLTLLPIFIAKLYRKRIIFLPMSFGPFAHALHEKLTLSAITNSTFYVRESVSKKKLVKSITGDMNVKLVNMPDLALLNFSPVKHVRRSDYVVVTARDWLSYPEQSNYEKGLAEIIDFIWERHHLKTVYISMAINEFEDDDRKIGVRIKKILKNPDKFMIHSGADIAGIMKIISKARYSLCTRMHAAIFSIITDTPTICIAYEHKAVGIFSDLKLKKWQTNIDSNLVPFIKEKITDLSSLRSYQNYQKDLKQINYKLMKNRAIIVADLQSALLSIRE